MSEREWSKRHAVQYFYIYKYREGNSKRWPSNLVWIGTSMKAKRPILELCTTIVHSLSYFLYYVYNKTRNGLEGVREKFVWHASMVQCWIQKKFVLSTISSAQRERPGTQQDLTTKSLHHIRKTAERFWGFWPSLNQPQSNWPGHGPRGSVTALSFRGDNDKTSGMLTICAMNVDASVASMQINDASPPSSS